MLYASQVSSHTVDVSNDHHHQMNTLLFIFIILVFETAVWNLMGFESALWDYSFFSKAYNGNLFTILQFTFHDFQYFGFHQVSYNSKENI